MVRQLPLLLCCLGWLFTVTQGTMQKGASISVRARWQGTSYLLEAAEFLADESQQSYWQFLDSLTLPGNSNSSGSSDDSTACWHSVLDQSAGLCWPQVAKILPVVLGVRQYSARLEMFRQLAKQRHTGSEAHCCFVDVHGTTVTDPEQLAAATNKAASAIQVAKNSSSPLQETDHVFNPDKQDAPGAVAAILYAAPGAECWSPWHEALKAAAANAPAEAPVVYAHRPVLSASCKAVHPCATLGTEEQLVLPGYGVEAVLKNMEYSAIDDKSKADAAAAAKTNKPAGTDNDAAVDIDTSDLGEMKGFKFDVLAKRKPHLVQELMTFRDTLLSTDDDEKIKVWDLKDAGLQATSRVAAAADPLRLLTEISQNFPSLVSSLTRQQVPDRLRREVQQNSKMISPGQNFMLLNGMLVEVKNFELYSFLDRLRIELRLQGQLQSLGIGPGLVRQLLETRADDNEDGLEQLRLDLTPMKQVLWLNNPERDKQYSHLPRNVNHLLNMFPGRLTAMAVNLMHLVVIADPLSPEAVAMAGIMYRMHGRLLPLRLGMLPVVSDAITRVEARRLNPGQIVELPTWQTMSNQERFVRGLLTLKSVYGPGIAWDFWRRMSQHEATLAKGKASAIETVIKNHFSTLWSEGATGASTSKAKVAAKKPAKQAFQDLQSGSGYSSEAGMQLTDISSYIISKGLAHLPKPMWSLNGLLNPISEANAHAIDHEVGYGMMYEMQTLQEHVYFGRIDDEQSVLESLMESMVTVRRWNPSVLGMDEDASGEAQKLVLAGAAKHPAAGSLVYLHAKDTGSRVKPVSHWLIVDLATNRGRALALAGLDFLADADDELEPESSRLALLLAPVNKPSALDVAVVLAQQAFNTDEKVVKVLKQLISEHSHLAALPAGKPSDADNLRVLQQLAEAAGIGSAAQWKPTYDEVQAAVSVVAITSDLVVHELGLPLGAGAVITNGRVVWDHKSPTDTTSPGLVAEDFQLLQLYAMSFQRADVLAQFIKAARLKANSKKAKADSNNTSGSEVLDSVKACSDVVMVTASALAAQLYPDSRFGSLQGKQVSEVLGSLRGKPIPVGPSDDSELHITAILDPLAREAQRLSQVMLLLQDVLSPSMQLYLNPQLDLSDMPLKSFYRYALPEFERDESGRLTMPGAPSAYFSRLPLKRVLTLNLELPESWLVEPVMALHDLDNLRLADIPEQVAYAEYELEAIMLTGSCNEVDSSWGKKSKLPPPRGLQLHLGTNSNPHQVDTLVMQNLGYFQLKASPGPWQLSIAPGRSRELYQLVASSGGSSADMHWGSWRSSSRASSSGSSGNPVAGNATGTDYSAQVLLHSFTGKHLVLKVQKRPGKEGESLLPADDKSQGGQGSSSKVKASDIINVFTVASGHMYERLQKIMILSVIKNTKSRVKFWIIKNYMSPHHKRIIPAMAQHYGFDYEFVTYKWPHWLHKQTDKQRIIWAYKILFLDVLFPLDVPRMIFVDSDQVIRTDLAELYRMDLKGAPTAYTPFCDNNKEMDPYRFWKTGFWANHLMDKPYHISALYLIDLVRFRQLAAGDQYRVIYENLSKDPNSLANLDQDLPNYAQHSIPIHSLPQEWLWCESWCGNETKPKARTIDLCNNPKTKEPKLSAARRIIAEWPDLDQEQADFTASVDAKFKAQEAAFAAAADSSSSISGSVEGAAASAAGICGSDSCSAEAVDTSQGSRGPGIDHSEL